MRFLIDSHIAIWMVVNPNMIKTHIKNIILNPSNLMYISTVSLWEISLKFGLGKLNLLSTKPEIIQEELEKACQVLFLDLTRSEVISYYKLYSLHHKDPFDRMLIWQAMQNNLTMITDDEKIHKYVDCGLKVVW
jgi:PIN domain nuclease of toxin-antitoxin system